MNNTTNLVGDRPVNAKSVFGSTDADRNRTIELSYTQANCRNVWILTPGEAQKMIQELVSALATDSFSAGVAKGGAQ